MTNPHAYFYSHSQEETLEVGRSLAKTLLPGDVLLFFGQLGSGKTSLAKGIIQELTGIDPQDIPSPTFTYLNIYPGNQDICHFDLYRCSSEEQFLRLGFSDFFARQNICCVEWPECIPASILHSSNRKFCIRIDYEAAEKRSISITRTDP